MKDADYGALSGQGRGRSRVSLYRRRYANGWRPYPGSGRKSLTRWKGARSSPSISRRSVSRTGSDCRFEALAPAGSNPQRGLLTPAYSGAAFRGCRDRTWRSVARCRSASRRILTPGRKQPPPAVGSRFNFGDCEFADPRTSAKAVLARFRRAGAGRCTAGGRGHRNGAPWGRKRDKGIRTKSLRAFRCSRCGRSALVDFGTG